MDTATADLPDLRAFTRVVVVTGAGISAASGVPTYRQASSGWTDGNRERMSRGSVYGNYLSQLWPFWSGLRATTAAAQPNAAHRALATAQDRCAAAGGWLRVLTQNVDGLHTRAGSTDVLELHGSIHRTRCMRRGCGYVFADERTPTDGSVPRCPVCAKTCRPDIVLFEERLDRRVLRQAEQALGQAQLCLYVGTSGAVWPARDFVAAAARSGAYCLLVNADPWEEPHPAFHAQRLGPAQELLPGLLG